MATFRTINIGLVHKDLAEMGIRGELSSTVSEVFRKERQLPIRSGALNGGKKWSKDDVSFLVHLTTNGPHPC